jgi:hypothetical protein
VCGKTAIPLLAGALWIPFCVGVNISDWDKVFEKMQEINVRSPWAFI